MVTFLSFLLLISARHTVIIPGAARDAVLRDETPYMACAVANAHFPVRVAIATTVDPRPWRAAFAEWNSHYPGTFLEVSADEPSDATIQPSARTWVQMPCGSTKPTVYAGTDTNLDYWAAHELGHVLGLRDWIQSSVSTKGYMNPGSCPSSYRGIMSYCSPRTEWWGDGDDAMMRGAFNR
ncbi:hypothetical protein AYO38_04470 [bacterium SCGC AG-212-C10]|nr:hypothetical protein AYO38_04470 [bacterium SCGC AG-212-C10]